ncbi:MAG: hypothetical protein OXU23_01175 [Candidatus Poribacteria bacterium]|nr:hypothetical protein [Candidatus Poribacteria bacterium]
MALGTIDIQYIYNKFAGKVGVDTFFASWMRVHLLSTWWLTRFFGGLVKKEIVGELNGSVE